MFGNSVSIHIFRILLNSRFLQSLGAYGTPRIMQHYSNIVIIFSATENLRREDKENITLCLLSMIYISVYQT
jgi:hypothetical protein